MSGTTTKWLVLATGGAAILVAWFAVPHPELVWPRSGPAWYRDPLRTAIKIREFCVEHAKDHRGRYPESLDELIPDKLYPIADPVLGKRAWDAKHLWRSTRWIICGAIAAWTLVFLFRRLRAVLLLVALGATAFAAARTVHIVRATATPPYTYDHLRFYRVLLGVRDPIPSGIPFIWTAKDSPIESMSRRFLILGGGWAPFDYFRDLDAGALERFFVAPVAEVLARAETGDVSAYLALAVRKERQAADFLAERKHSGKPHRLALWGLYMLDDRRAGRLALQALAAKDLRTKIYAVELLRYLKPEGATQALIPLLRPHPLGLHCYALGSLGCDGDPAALPHLEPALTEPRLSRTTRMAVLGALARMRTPDALRRLLREIDAAEEGIRRAWLIDLLSEAGELAVPRLTRFLSSGSSWEREGAVRALGRTGSPKAIEPLLSVLDSQFWAVVEALAHLGPRGKDKLFELATRRLARHANARERGRAATLLGRTGNLAAVPLLLKLLDDPDVPSRDVAWALGRLKAKAAVGPLIGRLGNPKSRDYGPIAEALLVIGDPRGLAAVRDALPRRQISPSAGHYSDGRYIEDVAFRIEPYLRYLEEKQRRAQAKR